MHISSRRDFLKRSTLAGATLAMGPVAGRLAQAADTPGSKMKLGLVTYLWGKDWKLPTLIDACTKSRVLGVETRTTHAHGIEPSLHQKERIEIRKRFEDSAVTFVGPGSNERFDHPDPAALAKAIESTKAFVKLSHDCGGSGVKVKPNSFHKDVPHEKTIEQIGKSLNTLGRFAAEYEQEIRLEVHGQCSPLAIIKQIVDVADHPNVGVCWNSNDQDLQGKGLEHNFRLVEDRFAATAHVRELDRGQYPYQQLVGLFVASNYDGWILLECRTNPADRIAALIHQRTVWETMVGKACITARQ